MVVRRTLAPIVEGENTADNIFDSPNVVANSTGTILERLQYIQDNLGGGGGGGGANIVEQADVGFANTATAVELDIVALTDTTKRYLVRDFTLTTAHPGLNTITVRLYKLVNDVVTLVDWFDIDSGTYESFYSSADLFARENLAGDYVRISIITSAGSYAFQGQYSHAKTV